MATTDQSIRSYLDSLGQLPGSILYRNTIAWEALPPGQDGQLLTIDAAGLPAWTDRGNYFPALMQYDGATTEQSNTTVPLVDAAHTVAFRFTNPAPGSSPRIWYARANNAEYSQCFMNASGRITIIERDTGSNPILNIQSIDQYNDGAMHYGWLQFDPDTAALEFIIDGQNADNPAYPSRSVTAGTLRSDTTGKLTVGNLDGLVRNWEGTIGAFGWKNSDLPNWQDFMESNGWPKPIDHDTWTQWVGQPPVWHESGALQWNRGSAGAFTPSGNLTLADPLDWN